jgi:CRISPR/Cas system-associated protein Cas5 (RAMP superfamily)
LKYELEEINDMEETKHDPQIEVEDKFIEESSKNKKKKKHDYQIYDPDGSTFEYHSHDQNKESFFSEVGILVRHPEFPTKSFVLAFVLTFLGIGLIITLDCFS